MAVFAFCQHRLGRTDGGLLYDGRAFGPDDRIVLLCAGYVEGLGLN